MRKIYIVLFKISHWTSKTSLQLSSASPQIAFGNHDLISLENISITLYAYSEYPHTSQNLNRHRVPLYLFHTLELKTKNKTTAIKIKGFTVYSDK